MVLLFRRAPGLALRLAEWKYRLSWRATQASRGGAVPRRKELHRLFQTLSKKELRRIQVRTAICRGRNDLLIAIERAEGHERLQPMVDLEPGSEGILNDLIARGRGVILTTWHLGPTPGTWAALRRFPAIRLLKVQNRGWLHVPQGWELAAGSFDAIAGLALMRLGRKHLRGGGWLAMTFDHTFCATRQHLSTFFGRRVGFRSGVAAMAQSADVPIVLLSAHWADRDRRVLVRVHEPVYVDPAHPDQEAEIVQGLVSEMEKFVRAHPWEQDGPRCRRILDFPLATRVRPDALRLPGDRWGWKKGRRSRMAASRSARLRSPVQPPGGQA